MADKKPGYQYNIFDQIESDKQIQNQINEIRTKKQEYKNAIDKLQKDLEGLSNNDSEDRNMINSINREIRFNETEIDTLKGSLSNLPVIKVSSMVSLHFANYCPTRLKRRL